jgi:hypothetical protein
MADDERSTPALRENLARWSHTMWARWMAYMFSRCREEDGTYRINPGHAARWERQMTTDYHALPESEKASNRNLADEILAVLRQHPASPDVARERLRLCSRDCPHRAPELCGLRPLGAFPAVDGIPCWKHYLALIAERQAVNEEQKEPP